MLYAVESGHENIVRILMECNGLDYSMVNRVRTTTYLHCMCTVLHYRNSRMCFI